MDFKSSGRILGAIGVLAFGAGAVLAKGGTAKPPPTPPPASTILPAPPPTQRIIPAANVLTPPTSAVDRTLRQFSVTGFIQSYTFRACPNANGAGDVVINGTEIVIPCNMIVQMPANTVSWAEFTSQFGNQKVPAPPATGLAYDLASTVGKTAAVNPSFELRLEGNIVAGRFIAALGFASQQSVNTGSGVISAIDLTNGRLVVTSNNGRTVELEINDPNARFGRAPPIPRDDRLSVDSENPTISSATGYPMCVPRTANDAECPAKNRPSSTAVGGCRDFITGVGITPPNGGAGAFFNGGANGGPHPSGGVYCTTFVMKAPPGTPVVNSYPPVAGANEPDATKQAPFAVGDFISWSGSLLQGIKGVNAQDLFSVHTITANVGIYTQPGTLPVYVRIGEFGLAGDQTAGGAATTSIGGISQEVQNRLTLEADVSDITAIVDVYLIDTDKGNTVDVSRWVTPSSMTGRSATGTDLNKGALTGFQGAGLVPKPRGFGIEGGIVTQWDGAQISRARIRATKAAPGLLQSPSRMVRVVARSICNPDEINTIDTTKLKYANATPATLGWKAINTASSGVPGVTSDGTTCIGRAIAANGLQTGQYQAPVFEFIFPENTGRGDPIVPSDFWNLNFLGGDKDAAGPLQPQPW
jgi:hypothetical protein